MCTSLNVCVLIVLLTNKLLLSKETKSLQKQFVCCKVKLCVCMREKKRENSNNLLFIGKLHLDN